MQIVVEDLLINYQLVGKGRLVLLLHGWGDNSKGLNDLNQALSSKYQVLAVDLPGFGASQAPKEAWRLDNYGSFLASLLKKLNLEQPYAVIGHSNGGALAIRATSLRLLKPKKLILLAASGVRTSKKTKRTALKVVAKTGNVVTFWLPENQRQSLRKKLYGSVGSDMLVAPHLQETFKNTVRQDVQSDASKLDLPTLLIYADKDKAVELIDGQRYHQLIKGSKLEVVTGAGHFVHLERPDKVTQLIEEFLK